MDTSNKSIRNRLILVVIVLLMWLSEIFPINNGDYFKYARESSKANIESKAVEDSKLDELLNAISSAEKAKRDFDSKETRMKLNEALAAEAGAISKSEAVAFEKAFAKAQKDYENEVKKNASDPMPMTKAYSLENATQKLKLYKFIDTPGSRPGNRKITRHIEKIVAGKVKYGIDLKGGVEFTMKFNIEDLTKDGKELEAEATRDTIIEILRNRIDSTGLAEVELRPFSENAIMIRVPAVNESEVASIRTMLMKQAKLEFRQVLNPGDPAGEEFFAPDSPGQKIWLSKDVLMGGGNIKSASARQNAEGQWLISKTFNQDGAVEFGNLTRDNVGRRVAIVLDDVCYSAPNINEPITTGSAQISGSFTEEEAKELAVILQSGSMPVELLFDGESRTDPTLGAESVKSGILSCVVGLTLVLIFMLFYYKKPGAVAVVALLANILLVIGSMAMLGATFTLPGIAGIILTIGMAVDTNVLIFERIREELALGKTLYNSTREGFSRAFVTIFDANITTLITALILMRFGSGPIQGFAYTLAIGIVASMFTGIFMSRIFFDMMTQDHTKKELGGLAAKPVRTINFSILRKKAMVVSIVLLVIAIGSLVSKSGDAFSVDFAGGNALIYEVAEDVKAEDIVKRLEASKFQSPRVVVKSTITSDKKQLEVVVRESHEKFEDIADNAALYTKIDQAVRNGKTAIEIPRTKQQSVGGVVGEKFRNQALLAIVLSLVGIFLYITLRFESIFAVGAIAALAHDTIIAVGFFVLLGNQISLPVIAAMLTIIGYSLNDTIVVFDRIRENSGNIKKGSIENLMNLSINGTLNRTILTSVTTLIVVVILAIFGGGAISDFAVILVIGVIIGTYSSVFVAAPIVCNPKLSTQLELIHEDKVNREERMKNDQTVMVD
jgi:SecD/SecF fusion protein